jgi:uncharacterized protein (DUF1778 family)
MAESKKGGGGKLNRTQTVTLRLDPRLRYLTDLAARSQRRTTSGFIEWAIEESLKEIILDPGNSEYGRPEVTLADESFSLWDVDEPDRLVLLAIKYPHLMTHEEQILWKIIQENGYFWKGKYVGVNSKWTWTVRQESLIPERLREYWDTLKSVANGSEDKSKLPRIAKKSSVIDDNDDDGFDDIPF